jgi:hypothetical protein
VPLWSILSQLRWAGPAGRDRAPRWGSRRAPMAPRCPAEDMGHDQPEGRVARDGVFSSRRGSGEGSLQCCTHPTQNTENIGNELHDLLQSQPLTHNAPSKRTGSLQQNEPVGGASVGAHTYASDNQGGSRRALSGSADRKPGGPRYPKAPDGVHLSPSPSGSGLISGLSLRGGGAPSAPQALPLQDSVPLASAAWRVHTTWS